MAVKRRQAGFLVVLMAASALVWVIQNLPLFKGGGTGGYEVIANCSLVADRGNDGDSFKVRTPAGETLHLRLYFVDAPESAVKRYRNGDSNEKRLSYQSEYFSGLSQSKTVEAGQAAKQWVRERLAASSGFTVSTRHESVYDSGRIYALVSLREGGRERWLHELLVERGLVRIYTQGTDLPDGTSRGAQTRRLKGLEKDAKAARKGAWGLAS